VLGVYLILRDTSPSATCYADFTLSLLNREHFSRNEQYSEKQCKFTQELPAHVYPDCGLLSYILPNPIWSNSIASVSTFLPFFLTCVCARLGLHSTFHSKFRHTRTLLAHWRIFRSGRICSFLRITMVSQRADWCVSVALSFRWQAVSIVRQVGRESGTVLTRAATWRKIANGNQPRRWPGALPGHQSLEVSSYLNELRSAHHFALWLDSKSIY